MPIIEDGDGTIGMRLHHNECPKCRHNLTIKEDHKHCKACNLIIREHEQKKAQKELTNIHTKVIY